jgi:hypothetical protein
VSWSAVAFNPVPHSENRIHADDVAQAYGFRGGLVPGVVVSAYLLHPAAVAWGVDFASRGRAHVRVSSPVYDGEPFRVDVAGAESARYGVSLVDVRDTTCATAEVSLPDAVDAPPVRRGDPPLTRDPARPVATRAALERLRERGMAALHAHWSARAEITGYLREPSAMAPVYVGPGLATPAFVLGLSNWVLAGNLRMPAWLHLETRSAFFAPIEPDTEVVAEAAVVDLFERKGHAFVDLDVDIFGARDDAARASVRLRAIYRLRGGEAS